MNGYRESLGVVKASRNLELRGRRGAAHWKSDFLFASWPELNRQPGWVNIAAQFALELEFLITLYGSRSSGEFGLATLRQRHLDVCPNRTRRTDGRGIELNAAAPRSSEIPQGGRRTRLLDRRRNRSWRRCWRVIVAANKSRDEQGECERANRGFHSQLLKRSPTKNRTRKGGCVTGGARGEGGRIAGEAATETRRGPRTNFRKKRDSNVWVARTADGATETRARWPIGQAEGWGRGAGARSVSATPERLRRLGSAAAVPSGRGAHSAAKWRCGQARLSAYCTHVPQGPRRPGTPIFASTLRGTGVARVDLGRAAGSYHFLEYTLRFESPAAIPEPATGLLLSGGLIVGWFVRQGRGVVRPSS